MHETDSLKSFPVKWEDEYFVSKQRVLLTKDQLRIPGIRVFGHQMKPSASDPLVMHFHENAYEFMIITEGSFALQAAGKAYSVSGGDVFITHPGEIHSTNQMPLALGEFYWFQMDVSSIKDILFLNGEAADNLIDHLKEISTHVIHTDNKDIKEVMKKAFSLTTSIENRYMTAGYLYSFLNIMIEHSRGTPRTLTRDIEKALSYIVDNYTQEISLEDLAGYCNLSVSQFKQKFKRQIGISPRCFINLQKVEYAKSLILEGQSKTDIAMTLGFSSSSYFAAVFKKYTSCTPSEYKRQAQAK